MQAGASLAAVVINDNDVGSGRPQQDAAVQHTGDGVYAVSATLEKAGRYRIAIQLEDSQNCPAADADSAAVVTLQCGVLCVPAAAAAQCCRTELQAEPWVAGRAADLIVHQFDRQGSASGLQNRVCLHALPKMFSVTEAHSQRLNTQCRQQVVSWHSAAVAWALCKCCSSQIQLCACGHAYLGMLVFSASSLLRQVLATYPSNNQSKSP